MHLQAAAGGAGELDVEGTLAVVARALAADLRELEAGRAPLARLGAAGVVGASLPALSPSLGTAVTGEAAAEESAQAALFMAQRTALWDAVVCAGEMALALGDRRREVAEQAAASLEELGAEASATGARATAAALRAAAAYVAAL